MGLKIGDRLIQVGDVDLQGIGPLGFIARVYEAADKQSRVLLTVLRGERQSEAELQLIPFVSPWCAIPLSLSYALTAVIVLMHGSGSRLARTFFLASLSYSFQWTLFHGGPRLQTYSWAVIFSCSSLSMFPLILRTALLFPEEMSPTGARLPLWPWSFTLYGFTATSLWFGIPPLPPTLTLRANFVVTIAFIAALLVVLTQSFRHSGPLGRRRLKWVVYGVYIGTMPVLSVDALATLEPRLWHFHTSAVTALALIPLCILIAIIRFNLFDIDRLISETAAYSILLVTLISIVLLAGPSFSQAANRVTGVSPVVGQAGFFLGLLAAMALQQRFLRVWIDRRFFPERYALARGVEKLLHKLSLCEKPQTALMLIGERLSALLRPESCVVYQRETTIYASIYAHGSIEPTSFTVNSLLTAAFQGLAAPVEIEHWRRMAKTYLNSEDWSVLHGLHSAILLPIRRNDILAGFVILGPKQSGDVYTASDLALLTTLMAKVRERLEHLGATSLVAH